MADEFLTKVAEELPSAFFPYSFLSSISMERRKRLWVHRLEQQCHPRTVRLRTPEAVVQATFLPWDSDFFGRTIYRLDFLSCNSTIAGRQILSHIEQSLRLEAADYCFAVLPMNHQEPQKILHEDNWQVIENRVTYWRGDLGTHRPSRRFSVRPSQASDLPFLEETAVAAMNRWDRFRADSFYSSVQVDALMREWIRASVAGKFADAVLVPDLPDPKAFVTLRSLRDEWPIVGDPVSQFVLSAVHPDSFGWFPALVSEALFHFQSIGARFVTITTQKENQSVIRTLDSLGFHLGENHQVLRKVLK